MTLSAISSYLLYDIYQQEKLPVNVSISTLPLSQYDGFVDTPLESAVVRPDVFDDVDTAVGHDGTVTRDWLNANLYRVSSYHENSDGTFDVQMLDITGPEVTDWDELVEVFKSTPYTDENNYTLEAGVNCQGMVLFLADWCEKNDHTYEVRYQPRHVSIVITHRDIRYLFSFSQHPLFTVLESDE